MKLETYRVEREVSQRHWWFRGRRRILSTLLGRLPLPPPASTRILDAGCGTGANAQILAPLGEVVGVDISPEPLRHRRGAPLLLGRLEALPLASRRFDLVTAFDLLEHLDDDAAGARELLRVLRPGGLAVVVVPAFSWLWGLQDDVSMHKRRYQAADFCACLEGVGFELQRVTYFNLALLPPIAVGRFLIRIWRPSIASENVLSSPLLDRVLGAVFSAEAPLVARHDLPLGVSLLAVARRPQ